MQAKRREPDVDGLCPVLIPCEYCQDKIHKLWHFCTPDNTVFTLRDVEKNGIKVRQDKYGISILGGIPSKASSKATGVIDNFWTIRSGKWQMEKE